MSVNLNCIFRVDILGSGRKVAEKSDRQEKFLADWQSIVAIGDNRGNLGDFGRRLLTFQHLILV